MTKIINWILRRKNKQVVRIKETNFRYQVRKNLSKITLTSQLEDKKNEQRALQAENSMSKSKGIKIT